MREKLDIRRKNQITILTDLNEDASKASCILTVTFETSESGSSGNNRIRMSKLISMLLAVNELRLLHLKGRELIILMLC